VLRLFFCFSMTIAWASLAEMGRAAERPNILWIIGEDMGPDLSCYGDPAVKTPNLDRLAGDGARYTRAFTTAPVCSASRSALITGMYQTTIGAHHHRSHREDGYRLPEGVRPITDYLREAGYYTANVTRPAPGLKTAGKTDFNFTAKGVFDGSDWSLRKPGQPFFAQVSFVEPHREKPSDVWQRTRSMTSHVDPKQIALPPCYPDLPQVREDWAGYLDSIMILDEHVGRVLKRLDDEGLADNTVVFFFGDNGQCHVRGKQFLYDAGIHIPLLVRWPGHIKPGTVNDDLTSAIDISATSLALAGVTLPASMQGQAFLGPKASPPRDKIFAARDRCDETEDRIRCVRTDRYKYIRNFFPDRAYTQPNNYKERSYPVLPLMRQLFAEGKLTPEQAAFMQPTRPKEELYDLEKDPNELHNLAGASEQQPRLRELRTTLDQWIAQTNDQGRFPESASSKSP
jgi:N-sulfoglucosamine sulfohydrolase